MADLYSLVHEDAGPVSTFTTLEEAKTELEAVLHDEPTWITRLWIAPFTVVVSSLNASTSYSSRYARGSGEPTAPLLGGGRNTPQTPPAE